MQRKRHVIKVDTLCTSEVWFHGIDQSSSDWNTNLDNVRDDTTCFDNTNFEMIGVLYIKAH